MAAMQTTALSGIGVLVTRPAQQADALCALIEQSGGLALRMPVIEIAEVAPNPELERVITALPACGIALFISANAVRFGVPLVTKKWGPWPTHTRIGAVGQSTAQALAAAGLNVDVAPAAEFSSEGLLALPALQDVADQRIVIFRGIGGREALADTLRQRGAQVDYAEVYRRVRPTGELSDYLTAAQRDALDVIIVTSNEGVENLFAMAGERWRPWLLQQQLVVVGPRAAQRARELGFVQPAFIAAQASDEGLINAVQTWRAQQHAG